MDVVQAVELNPSSLVANYRLSVALLQLGQPSEALKFAGNALKLSPRHPQLRACLHAILDSLECVNEETVPETHLEQPRSAEKDKKAGPRQVVLEHEYLVDHCLWRRDDNSTACCSALC